MVNYLAADAALIRASLAEGTSVPDGADELFLLYAVLMRAKGVEVQAEDVHDAWSFWMLRIDPEHKAVVPFADLDAATRAEDSPFLLAIRRAAAAPDELVE